MTEAVSAVKNLVVDENTLPRDCYFDPRWLTHRRKVWSRVHASEDIGEVPFFFDSPEHGTTRACSATSLRGARRAP